VRQVAPSFIYCREGLDLPWGPFCPTHPRILSDFPSFRGYFPCQYASRFIFQKIINLLFLLRRHSLRDSFLTAGIHRGFSKILQSFSSMTILSREIKKCLISLLIKMPGQLLFNHF
jgi:hypothetical protein